MTDNEIVKAFDDLVRTQIISLDLPLIIQMLLVDVLVVLNRQRAEIAVLSMKNVDFDIENKAKDVFLNRNLPNLIKNAKTEVVREFSVAVQDAFAEYFKIDEIPVWYVTDKILGVEEAKIKELVGDSDA